MVHSWVTIINYANYSRINANEIYDKHDILQIIDDIIQPKWDDFLDKNSDSFFLIMRPNKKDYERAILSTNIDRQIEINKDIASLFSYESNICYLLSNLILCYEKILDEN